MAAGRRQCGAGGRDGAADFSLPGHRRFALAVAAISYQGGVISDARMPSWRTER
jgi:hypothetical protein